MANPTFAVPMGTSQWGDDGVQITPDTTATTYYPGELIARISATGLATHCDNTAGIAFAGINAEAGDFVVTAAGPSRSYMQVRRPWRFTAKIAAAVAGDEGRAVYARFSDEVSYSQTNSILVGWVDEVLSTTSVRVNPIYGPLTNLSVAANMLTFTGVTGANTIVMPDNLGNALTIEEGSNAYITFVTTNSAERVLVAKQMKFPDTIKLAFGDADDVTVNWDGTDLLVAQATADSIVKWGVSGAGINHVFYGDTATRDCTWDQTNDQLLFNDNAKIAIGTGAGSAGDITFSWNATKMLVGALTADSDVDWGVDGAGIDQLWYGDTASANMTWDQSADTLIFNGAARVEGLVVKTNGATAITTTRAVTRLDSGGVFTVSQAAAYTITVATPTAAGERYLFQLVGPAANDVTIVATGCTFEGTITIDAATIPATGSTLKFASGSAILGDNIELIATSTTKFLVRAIGSGAGGITVS